MPDDDTNTRESEGREFVHSLEMGQGSELIDPPVSLIIGSPVGKKIRIKDLPEEIRSAAYSKVPGWHPKLGRCFAVNSQAVVILPVHTKRQANKFKAENSTLAPEIILQSYLSTHGTGIVVVALYCHDAISPASICQMPSSFFDALIKPTIILIMVERKKPIASYLYDLSGHSKSLDKLNKLRSHVEKQFAGEEVSEWGVNTLYAKIPSAYLYYSLHRLSQKINYSLTPSEELSASWANSCRNMVEDSVGFLNKSERRLIPEVLKARSAELPKPVISILEIFAEADKRPGSEAYAQIQQVINPKNVPEIAKFISTVTSANDTDDPFEPLWSAVDDSLRLFLWNEDQTQSGQRLPWLTESGEVRYLELDPNHMQDFSNYWDDIRDLTNSGPLFELGRTISSTDVPIDPYKYKTDDETVLEIFPRVEDIQKAWVEIERLFNEAAGAKQWTIPPGAIVQGPFGAVSAIQLFESPNAVYGTIRDKHDRFLPLFASPERGEIEIRGYPWVDNPIDAPIPKGFNSCDEFMENTQSALSLLIAAIIRDFWVAEYRERVFTAKLQRRSPSAGDREDRLRVVYLPRIKYSTSETAKSSSTGERTTIRSTHKVREHLRRSDSASPTQRALARRYGFVLPAGFTFVSPHWRGHRRRQVIYRSRTALDTLYTKIEAKESVSSRPHWFQFEIDVKNLLGKLGFDAEHVSGTRNGDDGVDVYASRKKQGVTENWLVQCKCYAPKNKVGPKIIRELIGSLTDLSEDSKTRGMIVTTSSLTSGAKKLADKHGIRWVEGEEFQAMVSESDT
jgi:hypothetical protein